jgi:UDP:flavonoid glycosyltransferase YjiC (YdhE family)
MRPLLSIGSLLMGMGHAVKACVPEDYVDRFVSYGIPAVAMGAASKSFFLRYGEAIYDRTWGYYATLLSMVRETLDRQFEVVGRYIREADVVVASGYVFGAQSIAESFRLPLVHLVFAPVFFPSATTPPPGVRFVGMPGLLNRATWTAGLAVLNRAMLPHLNVRRIGLGLPKLRSVRDHFVAHLTLAIDPELGPLPPAYTALGFAQTAYPYFDDGSEVDSEILGFIRDGAAPIYIGFGSAVEDGDGKVLELVLEAVRRTGLRALINAGIAEGVRPAALTPGTLLVGQVPHRKLFPLVSAVVHHGGAGTIHTAAYAGRPQAAVVHVLDAYYLGERTHRLGLGPRPVHRRKLSSRSLSELLIAVAKTPDYLRNAQMLGDKLTHRDGTSWLAQLVLDRARNWNQGDA